VKIVVPAVVVVLVVMGVEKWKKKNSVRLFVGLRLERPRELYQTFGPQRSLNPHS
jgi:hypothetical protein